MRRKSGLSTIKPYKIVIVLSPFYRLKKNPGGIERLSNLSKETKLTMVGPAFEPRTGWFQMVCSYLQHCSALSESNCVL